MTTRLPWEIVETLPGTDADRITVAERRLDTATGPIERVHALVERALVHYWAPATGVTGESSAVAAERRAAWIAEAEELALTTEDPDACATALLGRLYALWGPTSAGERAGTLDELHAVRPAVADQELRIRIIEWEVTDRFDAGDPSGVRAGIAAFLVEGEGLDSPLFRRRELLWRANLAMLEGDIDTAVRINEEAIASTADLAGSPFSFQNVAITTAIAGYFRRSLAELIDAIRSIRASSPRVASNWDVGLTFALSEVGEHDEATDLFAALAPRRFAPIPRDLNWLVCIQLLGLVAVNLEDRERAEVLLDLLLPFADTDGTHGSGYASYGPVGRVVGLLAACVGSPHDARRHLDRVIAERHAGPWTTIARMDRARITASHDPAAALVDAATAADELRALGLTARADEATALATTLRLAGQGAPIARRDGDTWTLSHPSGRAQLRCGVGIRLLVKLLARPGDPIDVLDLDERIDMQQTPGGRAETVLDTDARAAYRERVRVLEAAPALRPTEQEELAFLRRELAGGGYAIAAPEIERARVRVTQALRRTLGAVTDRSPALGAHLAGAVVTGRMCSYEPTDGTAWRIES